MAHKQEARKVEVGTLSLRGIGSGPLHILQCGMAVRDGDAADGQGPLHMLQCGMAVRDGDAADGCGGGVRGREA